MVVKIYVRLMLFWTSDEGATATEYALLLCFVALAILGGAAALGNELKAAYEGFSIEVAKWH